MSDLKATPGPWEAVTKDDPRGQPVGYYPGLVAIISGEPHLSVVASPEGRETSPEEWGPNAHLISAAPDLYAALEELLGTDEHPNTGNLKLDMEERERAGKAREAAYAALAKARGESP